MPQTGKILAFKILCRIWPALYQQRLTRWARAHGITRPLFSLSFDCDTDRDAQAAVLVQRKLAEAGISAAYAVPGALLEDHWHHYSQLTALGGYFINHGYRRHAEFDANTGKTISTFSYAGCAPDVWMEDIEKGHAAIHRLTGQEPDVFRTPHFGGFVDQESLRQLYGFLRQKKYRISSSTTPVFAAAHGSAYKVRDNLYEMPLSGCLGKPNQLIDSWGFLGAPDAVGAPALLSALAAYQKVMADGVPLVLNLYFDPADIVSEPQVIEALCRFASWSRPMLDHHFVDAVFADGLLEL